MNLLQDKYLTVNNTFASEDDYKEYWDKYKKVIASREVYS